MLYDTSADVIRKALRGLAMAPSEAATAAGLPERDVLAASRGEVSTDIHRKLAPVLGLDAEALAGLRDYKPPSCAIAGIQRIELPFDDETVNAWLLEDGEGGHLLFDTGEEPDEIREALNKLGISSVTVLISHEHRDHVGGLPGLGGMARRIEAPKPEERLGFGKLQIRVIDLPGHCEGAVGYVIEGLDLPVCVTGDALFAGSIGGCGPGDPYREALESLRTNVMILPAETVLLTGHGPPSTVAAERRSNAFLAENA